MPDAQNNALIQTAEAFPHTSAVPDSHDLGAMLLEALRTDLTRCAFRFGAAALTRAELSVESRILAARLQEAGVRPGTPVVVALEHSLELVVAMCAVQLVGACAVPLDPDISAARRAAILADIGPAFVLSGAQERDDRARVAVNIAPPAPEAFDRLWSDPALAFIVYTSGSSGGPKGVMITRESYVRRMQHILPGISVQQGDLDLAWTPSSFITMVDELFLPVLAGLPTVLAPPEIRSDPRAFAAFVQREGVTTFRITPSLLNLILQSGQEAALSKVRMILCAGETLPADVQAQVHARLSAELLGFYGATEAPAVAFHAYERGTAPIETTICTAQPFVDFRIVNDRGADVAGGETGEIWVGGCAVAGGYFGKPDLTREKFVNWAGNRWFRTGDLGRFQEDGALEILGRADLSEVNIHGVRISLPEVRSALLGLEAVSDAWVSAVAPLAGTEPVLVAHCVMRPPAAFDPQALKAALSPLLPAAAVPRFFLAHDRFPLTANGKLDIRGLAQAGQTLIADRGTSAARAADAEGAALSQEAQVLLPVVLEVAEEILRCEDLTAGDDFFLQGGSSLLAVHFVLALSERLRVDLQTRLLFEQSRFADIAMAIAAGEADGGPALRLLRVGTGGAPRIFTINSTGNYARMAVHLDPAVSVYNLNIFGFTNGLMDRLDRVSLDELAGLLADQILTAHPEGPWHIMAFCQDGCLAVEVGRVIRQRTGEHPTLLLIDTFFLNHKPDFKMWVMRAVDLGPGYYLRKLKQRATRRAPLTGSTALSPEQRAALLGKSGNDRRLYQRFIQLFSTYRPQPYAGPVVLFVSREWRHVKLDCVRDMAVNGFVKKELSGLHDTIFAPGEMPILARAIEDTLSAPDQTAA